MKKMVTVHDKQFELFISESEIQQYITELASAIDLEYEGKDLVIIGILNGAFIFVSDLVKAMSLDPEISFLKYASYSGTGSTGNVKNLIGLNENFEGRHVLIVEDIIDTGQTLAKVLIDVKSAKPDSVKIATLFFKPDAFSAAYSIDFIGKNIPNKFVVGYGMDYNSKGRNLINLYQLSE